MTLLWRKCTSIDVTSLRITQCAPISRVGTWNSFFFLDKCQEEYTNLSKTHLISRKQTEEHRFSTDIRACILTASLHYMIIHQSLQHMIKDFMTPTNYRCLHYCDVLSSQHAQSFCKTGGSWSFELVSVAFSSDRTRFSLSKSKWNQWIKGYYACSC